MSEKTMRAAQQMKFGPPEVLEIVTASVPEPGPRQVLVRVHGCSLNSADSLIRSGSFKWVMGRKFPKGAGADCAGEVVGAGANVTEFKIGDRVWGFSGGFPGTTGTAAEFVVMKPASLSFAPRSIDLVSAAALPAAGSTALQALRMLGVSKGDRLLIIGASGGVGSTAVQLGVALGAKVGAVCSTSNANFCRSLGADEIIDYTTTDLSKLPANYDRILDCNGTNLGDYRHLLVRGGKFVTITLKGYAKILPWLVTPGPSLWPFAVRLRSADLQTLADYVDAGQLKPAIDREYPLQEIAAAHRALDSGHAQGKRVLRVIQ